MQKRHNEAKLSWLITLSLLPIIGHFLFFLLGLKYKNVLSKEKYYHSYNKLFQPDEDAKNVLLEKEDRFSKGVKHLTQRKFKNADFSIINHGEEYFQKLFQYLKKAEKFIHIEIYIIKRGEIWEELKTILINKAKQGVEIRIIVDSFGLMDIPKTDLILLEQSGIHLLKYGVINFPFLNSGVFYRTHKKYFIIDGKILFSGGNNISDEYACYHPKYGDWQDANFYVQGEFVKQYSIAFINGWKLFSNEQLSLKKYAPIYYSEKNDTVAMLLEDGPITDEATLEEFILFMINKSQNIIRFSTPYFVPTQKVLTALKNALMSGIKVEIYVPGIYDKAYVKTTTFFYLKELQKYGLKIYFLREKFLHSKMASFDDKYAYIGTLNIDVRSFYSQYEIISFVKGEAVKQINQTFWNYKNASLTWEQMPNTHKKYTVIFVFFVKLFKPLL
ncbi:phosphatidylserine/phosphatidylglycerophosphate/cardiolipin synthase family protein [Mycoplasma iguanae]|uniref:Phosphatidylserine/phosphatidylglycerophosphate/ cardiolipin synthase family protein n=1 Tax=Mycoplasma iguanae TaxID=292461 RepID=A0ABY5RB41_9MOLU|nr:phosphatidylserine/phosphatidylglycerophosphate/cardiolipin synthase family protein [Mycoplasma iguanae]UVD81567.1 phosphatidylserine/phosphatidylglycerophosphate/cardiolipin synthase family protein [Mycoplasma iguanae]